MVGTSLRLELHKNETSAKLTPLGGASAPPEFNMKARREFSIWISLVADLRAEAKRQGVTALTLARRAIEQYLDAHSVHMRLGGRTIRLRLKTVNLSEPEVYLTPEEMADADEAMRIFREEDR